jgi:hypothetical protein
VAGCVLLAMLLGVIAYWALLEPWREGAGSGAATSGSGSGRDSGAGGGGDGTGTGLAGAGPGAGLVGDGPGADPTGTTEEPQGSPQGSTPQAATPPSGNDAPEPALQPVPDLGFSPAEEPDVPQPPTAPVPSNPVGTASGTAREGAAGAARPGVPEFMGVRAEGKDVVYLLDFSGSMGGEKITYLKIELKRSIFSLTPKNTFQVVLFNHMAIENPTPGMIPATKQNTRACASWTDSQQAGGGTDPARALEIALTALKPDTIYLLTDGVFDDDSAVFALLKRHNPEGKVQINTIGFGYDVNQAVLEQIARENRGTYRFVDVPGSTRP